MSNEFDIAAFIKNETNIERVKERLYASYNLYKSSQKDAEVYRFLLSMFNLSVEFEHFENPVVSIVIPVKNEFMVTQFLLNSIHSNTRNIPYEIIIADDNSIDETVNIQAFFPNIFVSKNDAETPGFLYNVTHAVEKARGKYILLLNNDMLVLENYLLELLNVIENHSDIGIVGSKNISIEGKVQECGVKVYPNANVEFLGIDENSDYMDYKEYVDCDYCSGCSILFKKETWDKAGGFDKFYAPAYYEDSDFAFNVRYNLGLKSVCVPKSKIYHYKGVSYAKDLKHKTTIQRNKDYFISKWGKYLNR